MTHTTDQDIQAETVDGIMTAMFRIIQNLEDMPAIALYAKLGEEVGEFGEVVLTQCGYNVHKTKELESPFGEAADVIYCVMGVLAKLHPAMSPIQLVQELYNQLQVKGNKYAGILINSPATKNVHL